MRAAAVVVCVALAAPVNAQPARDDGGEPAAKVEDRPNAIYVEALGKGGVWGVGYERHLAKWLGLGGVASFTMLDGQRMYSLTPYVLVYPLRSGSHGMFVDGGANLIRIDTPSPVPEWDGMSESGIGAELSAGYEYRGKLLFRFYVQAVAGKSGVAPWGGASIGWTL
ncbi:MAG: hypothetical protein HOV81_00865 [Kofleriaceae bacterium]|nr:hypothetical protein [Kofleriaceae bacterium]